MGEWRKREGGGGGVKKGCAGDEDETWQRRIERCTA